MPIGNKIAMIDEVAEAMVKWVYKFGTVHKSVSDAGIHLKIELVRIVRKIPIPLLTSQLRTFHGLPGP